MKSGRFAKRYVCYVKTNHNSKDARRKTASKIIITILRKNHYGLYSIDIIPHILYNYPVGESTKEEINDDRIVMNMINSFLGRMHLASHLEWMNRHQLRLVREGVECYNSISTYKHNALPYLPCGFTGFGDKKVVSGFKSGNKVFLDVWTLTNKTEIEITLDDQISNVKLAYPFVPNANYSSCGNKLSVSFHRGHTAAFF